MVADWVPTPRLKFLSLSIFLVLARLLFFIINILLMYVVILCIINIGICSFGVASQRRWLAAVD